MACVVLNTESNTTLEVIEVAKALGVVVRVSTPADKDIQTGQVPQMGILVVCEHASNQIPKGLKNLGLLNDALQSHIAWDPGARGVSRRVRDRLNAVLVEGCISRLVYDCNRPPDAPSAVPERSEIYDIPGNRNLTPSNLKIRIKNVYEPFSETLEKTILKHHAHLQMLVTVHSFTPVFHDVPRDVEIGVLHGQDDRLAQLMIQHKPENAPYDIRLNAPYSAADGVAHTLDRHGYRNALPNVMLEIRNDLIKTQDQQDRMGDFLADWIVQCQAALCEDGGVK